MIFKNSIFSIVDSIKQLCRLPWNRGQPVGQVQQRMYGRSPTKAGLETVHQDLETLEADRQVEGNLAYHQRIVLKLAAHEVIKIKTKKSVRIFIEN